MKSLTGHLFLTFLIIVGSVLAVLGLVLGQLFPFFAEQYDERQLEGVQTQLEVKLEEIDSLSFSDKQEILNAFQLSEHQSKDFLSNEVRKFVMVIFSLFLVGFIIIWLATENILKNLLEPILNVTKTAKELAVGNYRARAFAKGSKAMTELKDAINQLANNLESMTKTRLIEEERLKTLVETMGSGLLMMNREGQIIIANQHFLKSYDLHYEKIEGKSFLSIPLPEELKIFIDNVFFTEQPERKQITLKHGIETKHKQVFGAPVIGKHGRWLGVVVVLHDITELIRLEQIRRDFVANVSHELRTPITSIKGFSETLLDGAYEDQELLHSFLEIIHKESDRLQMLVNDLLDLSKLERQGYQIEKEIVQMQDVIARVVEMSSQRLDEKDVQLFIDLEENLKVIGEKNRLIQIFTNLVNNAIMYSPEQSTIRIHAYREENYGVIEVIDEGIGISKENMPRIFERFYRVDTARSRNSGGTGLGLAIVKHLVELHDGKIDVESEAGKGTTMRVKIPVAK